jgi:hypothetical protein
MDEKDVLSFLWKEYEVRQRHYWSVFERFSLAIVAINIAPYVNSDLRCLGKIILLFPCAAFLLTLLSSWLLGAEYQRLRMVYKAYEEKLPAKIPRMPLGTWLERLVAKPIGSKIAGFFGIGLSAFSLLSVYVLWKHVIR